MCIVQGGQWPQAQGSAAQQGSNAGPGSKAAPGTGFPWSKDFTQNPIQNPNLLPLMYPNGEPIPMVPNPFAMPGEANSCKHFCHALSALCMHQYHACMHQYHASTRRYGCLAKFRQLFNIEARDKRRLLASQSAWAFLQHKGVTAGASSSSLGVHQSHPLPSLWPLLLEEFMRDIGATRDTHLRAPHPRAAQPVHCEHVILRCSQCIPHMLQGM